MLSNQHGNWQTKTPMLFQDPEFGMLLWDNNRKHTN